MMNNLSLLGQQAVEYVKQGFSVIPLFPKSKRAMVKWMDYCSQKASVDQIIKWWKETPDANIGLITGKVSNLVVLDLDGKESEDFLKNKGFDISQTSKVMTPHGSHYYFNLPQHQHYPTINIAVKIDCKGERGYVVAPPSVHPNGTTYQWDAKGIISLTDVPQWIEELMTIRQM